MATDRARTRLARMKGILAALPTPPVLVTIARSSDHWTLIADVAEIETAVLKQLREIFPD